VADELGTHIDCFGLGAEGQVFTSLEGRPLAYANFYRRAWVPAVRAAGLEPFSPHGLRHTAVALAIAAGAHPKQIQELCRHRSIHDQIQRVRRVV
jgi:integrase